MHKIMKKFKNCFELFQMPDTINLGVKWVWCFLPASTLFDVNQSLVSTADGPFAAQAVSFSQIIKNGEIPAEYIESDYIMHQFVERLVHYILSVPQGSFAMPELGRLLEIMDPTHQVLFFKRLKENSPNSLKQFAPLYYGFMAEFDSLLFTWLSKYPK